MTDARTKPRYREHRAKPARERAAQRQVGVETMQDSQNETRPVSGPQNEGQE